MKKICLFLVFLMVGLISFSQNSTLVIFTEQGEPFYVVINGVKQNSDARSNVKISDLKGTYLKAKIIFKNTSLGQLDKTMMYNPGMETTYCIRKNNKNKWVIRWQSEVPVESSITTTTTTTTQTIPVTTNTTTQSATTLQSQPVTDTKTITTTQQSTTTNAGNNGNIGINVTDPVTGVQINMNLPSSVNLNGTGGQGQVTTTGTTTTTTTTTTQNSGITIPSGTQPVVTTAQSTVYVPGYDGKCGCPKPVTQDRFNSMKASIAAKDFEATRITMAKQIVGSNCFLASQIKELLKIFDFEASKLEMAKYCYKYTYDQGNYYQINDVFDFEASTDELTRFVEAAK